MLWYSLISTTWLEPKKWIVTEEQSIFRRYSRVVLMKGILWYLSSLFQAAAIQENSYLGTSRGSNPRIDPPEGSGIIEGTYACIYHSCMP